ncbi:MAG: ComEC family competence protein [Candidatus Omnitrophica bacterium]|nr:ComEC family competence protein [Candidatus Omnitrophota bacterium]
MRSPLAFAAIPFGVGVGLAWGLRPSAPVLCGLIGFSALILLWGHRRPMMGNLSLMGLIVALGVLRGWVDAQPPPHPVAPLLTSAPQPISGEGIVVSDVEWTRPSQGPARRQGWFEIRQIRQGAAWIPADGRLLLRLPPTARPFAYGEHLRLHGTIRGPRPQRPGGSTSPARPFDEGDWLWLRGACGVLTVSDPEAVERLDHPASLWAQYRRSVASFREQLEERGRSLLGSLEAAYLEAFLLGEGGGIPRETWEAFKKSGTVHVLVVSGLHVGLIGFLSLLLLSLVRIPRNPRYLLLIGILISYCVLTGAKLPILRSAIMGILLCLSKLSGDELPALNSLGLAALLILAVSPRALADASFQLSFASVAGLLVFSPWFGRWLGLGREEERPDSWGGVLRRKAAQALAVSCGAWSAVSPFVAWHFHRVTPIAVFANLIIVPWSSLLIAVGFLLYLVSLVNPWAALPIAASFGWMVNGLNRLVGLLAALPGASWGW